MIFSKFILAKKEIIIQNFVNDVVQLCDDPNKILQKYSYISNSDNEKKLVKEILNSHRLSMLPSDALDVLYKIVDEANE